MDELHKSAEVCAAFNTGFWATLNAGFCATVNAGFWATVDIRFGATLDDDLCATLVVAENDKHGVEGKYGRDWVKQSAILRKENNSVFAQVNFGEKKFKNKPSVLSLIHI